MIVSEFIKSTASTAVHPDDDGRFYRTNMKLVIKETGTDVLFEFITGMLYVFIYYDPERDVLVIEMQQEGASTVPAQLVPLTLLCKMKDIKSGKDISSAVEKIFDPIKEQYMITLDKNTKINQNGARWLQYKYKRDAGKHKLKRRVGEYGHMEKVFQAVYQDYKDGFLR